MLISATDARLRWLGHADLEIGDGWARAWRMPAAVRPLLHPDLCNVAGCSTGVRLAFSVDSRRLVLRVIESGDGWRPFDVVRDGNVVATVKAASSGLVDFGEQPAGSHAYEIWLPQNTGVRVMGLDVDDDAKVGEASVPKLRWLHYGSSISQCNEAASPVQTWPALVARQHQVDLRCFGFSGQCHLDPLVAREMARSPADAISLKVGINIYGKASLNERSFRWNLLGFVRLLRDAHPTIPLALISPIFSPVRETVLNKADFHLTKMREEVAAAAATLQAQGDSNLFYLDGLELLSPTDRDRLPDFLHPDTAGYTLMAERFSRQLGDRLFPH